MAGFRQGLALALSLTLWAAAARGGGAAAAAPAGLYDRPVLVVDPGMHTAMIRRAAADRDGRWAVTGSDDKTVRVWSLADGALARTIRLPAGPGQCRQGLCRGDQPGRRVDRRRRLDPLEEVDRTGADLLFDRASGAWSGASRACRMSSSTSTFSPDGRRLAPMLGRRRDCGFTSATGWAEAARDEDYGDSSYGAAFAPDGRLATTSYDGKVRLYAAGLQGTMRPAVVDRGTGRRPTLRRSRSAPTGRGWRSAIPTARW